MKRLILDVEGNVQPLSSKTHISYIFHLNQPVGKLWIDFAYWPKNLEDREQARDMITVSINTYAESNQRDRMLAKWESFLPLKNLITVSVDDPERHRGAGHRHDPKQLLFIDEQEASPGFVSGRLIEGLWQVTLSLHAIVTDNCHYKLQVQQEEV
ncbi:hypothetical protein Back11_27360 [Paenibacillus baekrokdamisoli]|uniref:Uncharacterized protein n=1 Tax=Paenibacillus baekrokdamisoli TaxID=1712516 RepID=A0A3G9J6J8_9BACL|nr:hypothetical protein [Paenibacillus baekrokdamisoli]MBB3070390.1 hypothetical protein [Paenibacillus baekrokdamisoli]BBH21391.1 hypothetical protein Back11_27360 [Paenibacillus baekrokdamisoli]